VFFDLGLASVENKFEDDPYEVNIWFPDEPPLIWLLLKSRESDFC